MKTPVTEESSGQQGAPAPQPPPQPPPQPGPAFGFPVTNEFPPCYSLMKLSGSESQHSSPKNSPKQNAKAKDNPKIEINGKESSQNQTDSDQQDKVVSKFETAIDVARGISQERYVKERKESRASERSKKKWYNAFFSTYKSRSEEVKRYFRDIPPDERLVVDYSCALQKEILVQGRLYVTQNYLCFYANIFGWETCVSIRWKDVSSVTKEKTALVIPNAILVSTLMEKLFFTTFTARDEAYVILFRVWQNALMDQPLKTQELWELIHMSYGEELGFTSDDQDYVFVTKESGFQDKFAPLPAALSANSLAEGCSGISVEKSGSEVASSPTDSTNKSGGGSINDSEQVFIPDNKAPFILGLPAAMCDNSSDDQSDADPNDDVKLATCSSSHEGRLIVSTILPVHIDQLFALLFTNSKFLLEFHTLRRTTDLRISPWKENSDTAEKIRTISMVIAVTQPLGPKTANVHETQIMQPCSKPGQLYSIDGEVVNSGIPYSDSFYIEKHYCLEKVGENETNLNVYAQLKYKKSVWGLMKSIIEKSTWTGLEDFYEALVKSLLAECDERIPKCRKGRRRHRTISTTPVLLPVDQIGSSVRGRGSFRVDGQRRSMLLYVVLALLLFLILLNALLYFELAVLEERMHSSKSSLWHTDLEILKNSPKTHEDWLKVLRHQEKLHRMELDKWQKDIKLAVRLLRKAEESLSGLQGAIKSPYSDEVLSVLERKEKQEL